MFDLQALGERMADRVMERNPDLCERILERIRQERADQGLPPTVQDADTLRRVAAIVAARKERGRE